MRLSRERQRGEKGQTKEEKECKEGGKYYRDRSA